MEFRTGIAVGYILYLIYIGNGSIDSIGILGLSFGWSRRNAHVYSINHLSSCLVRNSDYALAASLYSLVKHDDQMCIDVDVLGILLRIKTDWSLCHQVHTCDNTCH